MQRITNKPLFDLGRLVATAIGANSPGRQGRKLSQPATWLPSSQQLPHGGGRDDIIDSARQVHSSRRTHPAHRGHSGNSSAS